MATLTIEIDDKKLTFVKELLSSLSFVKIWDANSSSDLPDEDTDEEVIANIREGVRQMRLVEQGKMKSRPLKEFLKELDEL